MTIVPSQVIPASWGQQLSLESDGSAYLFGTPTSGLPGVITIAGGASLPSGLGLTAGIAMEGNTNGAPFARPAHMAQVQPNVVASWKPPSQLRVGASSFAQPGAILDSAQPPAQHIDVTFTPQQPTATLRYDVNSGFTAD